MNKQLKILMLCHLPLKKTLGGSKVYIEAAEEYKKRNHDVRLLGSDQYCPEHSSVMDEKWRLEHLANYVQDYIEANGNQYDVIEYEAYYLKQKPKLKNKVILVARSVLLDLHLKDYSLPRFNGIKSFIGKVLYGKKRQQYFEEKMNALFKTIKNSTFINVPNQDDKNILIKNFIPSEKIIVHPYGINTENITFSTKRSHLKKICFIGTFDNRKGAVEFPFIIKEMSKRHPDYIFKFLGVSGMFSKKEQILKYLNSKLEIEIIERFEPTQLDELLEDCCLGIFPSHLESFGYGALEMMARGIPVVGYNCPGVRELLPEMTTVDRGNKIELISLLSQFISNQEIYNLAQSETLKKVSEFNFKNQNSPSLDSYLRFLNL